MRTQEYRQKEFWEQKDFVGHDNRWCYGSKTYGMCTIQQTYRKRENLETRVWRMTQDETDGISSERLAYAQLLEYWRKPYPTNYYKKDPPPCVKSQ